ncbi:hypothetical protein Tco_0738053, partial [Tanacetum coccineum]
GRVRLLLLDYGFISTLDAETRRQRVEGVGYGIRDTWVNLREATEEIALDRQTRIFQSFESLIDDRQYYYETGYRTHAWMQDHRIDVQDSLIAALTAQVSSLQGHLATALGEIRALQARDQARADAPEGTASTAAGLIFLFLVSDNHNNMPSRRSSATARAAVATASPMTAAAVE